MNKRILEADSRTFQAAISSNDLTLVDFYAEWCGPCKVIAPSIDKLADEFAGTVRFLRLNVDKNPETVARYGVRSIPTLMIFKKGQPFRTMKGASPIGHYRGELQKVVTKFQKQNEKLSD